jgi:hypothetical protein
MSSTSLAERLRDTFSEDPLMTLAIVAALFALATTPIAFAVLGRLGWFKARRGRTIQRPEFSSIVCGMLLVMAIPAIFAALVIKSRSFDEDRYEFDPNKTWSVLEQGRGFRNLKEADEAVRAEMKRLTEERKNLVDHVKKLDEAMLALRASAAQSPQVAQAMPDVLERLSGLRRSIGIDAPQQLIDDTAPPASLPVVSATPGPATVASNAAPAPLVAPTAPAAPPASGLSKAQADAELATVPEPQRPLAAMLPLVDLPAGWTVGKSGPRHLETFNAENLFEKIDGRAESFTQYDVRGMAYTYYHPTGDESNEVQLYIFEMSSPLKALGKYGSEKPDGVKALPIGTEGYESAGSTLFHAGKYYTQIVSTKDDAKFSAFARELAGRIAALQRPAPGSPGDSPGGAATTPDAYFALLPAGPGRAAQKYVAQDVFGYSFLSDVFMADYEEEGDSWQGFLRPYSDPKAAAEVFDKYVEGAKQDGAEIKTIEIEGADRAVVSSNVGLVDVFFLKGNVVGGANGATNPGGAEGFVRAFAKGLPKTVPALDVKK